MSEKLQPHVRPIAFAGTELLLDMIYLVQSFYKIDLESLLILHCINDATMRPFMTDPNLTAETLTAARPPDDIRGAISRRMIADKTGLARETVRRKTNDLIASGIVLVDSEDRLRIAQFLDRPDLQRLLIDGHKVAIRYLDRLTSYGVDWRNVPDA